METKRCTKCGEEKALGLFNWHDKQHRWRTSWCKACHTKQGNAWLLAHPEKRKAIARKYRAAHREQRNAACRATNLKRDYGITTVEFDELNNKQNGLCAICCKPPTAKQHLCVDHDHKTGKIRALLCKKCNAGLGQFDDSEDLLASAMAYLEIYGEG